MNQAAKIVDLLLQETSLSRVLGYHAENGYVIISACRTEYSPETNKRLTKQLAKEIREYGFSLVPVYGGYVDSKGTESREEGFLVPAPTGKHRSRKAVDRAHKELLELGILLCQKYDQECLLYKPGAGMTFNGRDITNKAFYLKQDGKVKDEFEAPDSVNDAAKEFFTGLRSKPGKYSLNYADDPEFLGKSVFSVSNYGKD